MSIDKDVTPHEPQLTENDNVHNITYFYLSFHCCRSGSVPCPDLVGGIGPTGLTN